MKTLRLSIRRIDADALGERACFALGTIVLLLLALYGLCVGLSVGNVVVREEVGQKITRLEGELGGLESAYLEQKNAITSAFAHTRGFSYAPKKIFITRNASYESLTLNSRE